MYIDAFSMEKGKILNSPNPHDLGFYFCVRQSLHKQDSTEYRCEVLNASAETGPDNGFA